MISYVMECSCDDYTIIGRHKLLQCLLQVHKILSGSESYYILNNLYVTDYCVWIQHARYILFISAAYDPQVAALNSYTSLLKHWMMLSSLRQKLVGSYPN